MVMNATHPLHPAEIIIHQEYVCMMEEVPHPKVHTTVHPHQAHPASVIQAQGTIGQIVRYRDAMTMITVITQEFQTFHSTQQDIARDPIAASQQPEDHRELHAILTETAEHTILERHVITAETVRRHASVHIPRTRHVLSRMHHASPEDAIQAIVT